MREQILKLQNFLNYWFEGAEGLIELRLIDNSKVESYFYDSISKIPLTKMLNGNTNVYFGVSTRKHQRGTKEDVSEIAGLWQDLDAIDFLLNESKELTKGLLDKGEGKGKWKNNPQFLTKDEFNELMHLIEEGKTLAFNSLDKLPKFLKPTCIVDSGKGYHLYWKFREPMKINSSSEINSVESLNKRLANYISADHTTDVSRCYRLPNTKNVKLKGWQLETKITEFHPERQFDLSDFDWLPEVLNSYKESKVEVDIKDIPAFIPEGFWLLLEDDSKLKKTWEGKRVDLNDDSGSGLDMSLANILVKHDFSDGEIARILLEAPYPKTNERTEPYFRHTIRKARNFLGEKNYDKQNFNKVGLEEVKQVFKKWLFLKDDNLIDVSLAVIVANYFLDADPLWLLIVAPSSGAKTEVLRSLDGCRNVYFLSNLTKATLVSGQKGENDASLLPKLSSHILVMKDFTTVLEMRADDKAEILAQLREIYDGKYEKAFGTGKVFKWKGHVGFLAGVTTAIDDSLLVKQVLGERFILYRTIHEDRKSMTRQALRNTGKEKDMRNDLNQIFKDFLNQFQKVDRLLNCPDNIEENIIYLADLTAVARSSVPREGTGDRIIKYVPDPELPPRLAKQFKLLACGLALVREKGHVTDDEYYILKKIAFDTVPKQRKIAIKALLSDDWLKTREVADKIRYPVSTTKIILEDLHVLGIAERRFQGGREAGETSQTTPYEWIISPDFYENILNAGFKDDEL